MPAYDVLLIIRYIFCFHPLGALRLQSITLNLYRAACFMRSLLNNQYLCQRANLNVTYRFVPCQTQFYHYYFFNLNVSYRFDTFAQVGLLQIYQAKKREAYLHKKAPEANFLLQGLAFFKRY